MGSTSPSPPLRVFVSSTAQDLQQYRKVASEVITSLHWLPSKMEDFDAQPGRTVDACRSLLEQCHLVLLVVAYRQGWVPTVEQGGNGQDSITALERKHALDKGIPILTLLAHPSWPGDRYEEDDSKRKWMQNFRENLNQVASFFKAEEDQSLPNFRVLVEKTLLAYKERLLADQERPPQPTDGPGFLPGALKGLREGRGIPVVGSGIYGDGPLSSGAVAEALFNNGRKRLDAPPLERLSLATAAEYRERVEVTRDQFLDTFRRILEEQSKQANVPSAIELLAGLDTLRLIVSTTYDYLLENELEKRGRKYAIVSHIRDSYEAAEGGDRRNETGADEAPIPGKIVIKRPGKEAQFCRANLLHFDADECIIYKPLGSPFLNSVPDPELGIDTVVVTETDHAGFLQRLESPETGVPSAIKARFARQSLLFLGYTMDIWQYRLTMLLFGAAKRDSSRTPTLAVRVPGDEIEEVAWNRVNAQLIRMDPSQFASSASKAFSASAGLPV